VVLLFHIGILQFTQNLDDAVRGFKEGIKASGTAARFTYVNADGNADALPSLAARLQQENVDLIFACATPSALAAKELSGNIPVVFTPVFDPIGAGLVRDLDAPEGKVTGVCGMVRADLKRNFIEELLPNVNKLALLYHVNDKNSVVEAENFYRTAKDRFDVKKIALESAADISLLSERLPADLEVLFLPIGRILEENFSSIAYYADALRLPIIASHAPNVAMGALGALTASHEAMGETCGQMAAQLLAGAKTIRELPVAFPARLDILLNQFTADTLGIALPAAVREKAAEIYT